MLEGIGSGGVARFARAFRPTKSIDVNIRQNKGFSQLNGKEQGTFKDILRELGHVRGGRAGSGIGG